MASNDIQNKTATIYIDNEPARRAYEELLPKAEAYNKTLDDARKKAQFLEQAIEKSVKAGGKPIALEKELKKTNQTITNTEKALNKTNKQLEEFSRAIKSNAGPSLKQQEALVRKLWNEYRNLGSNTEAAKKKLLEYANASKSLSAIKDRIDQVSKAQKDTSDSGFLNSFFGNLAANLVTKATSLVTGFFSGTISEADQAEEAVSGLTVALENAGRLDLLQPLLDQADEFAAKYKSLDNDDITAVFTKLVDYGKLTQSQIKEVTDVIINYAAKQKVSLGEATDVVTKALEGSAKGLKIYGINLSEAKTVTERYNIIVDQLGKKVEGSQAAFENTATGIRAKFSQALRDGQEKIGKFIVSLAGLEQASLKNAVAAKKDADEGNVLIKRYEELSGKVNKTAAEKDELKSITNRLVGIFGTSVVSINKETGALELNVQATKDLIKQKLLLANSKASELALKYNAALEKEGQEIDNIKKILPALNELEKQAGKSFSAIKELQTGSSANARKVADNPLYRQIYDLGIQFENFSRQKKSASKDILSLMDDLKQLGISASDVNKLFNPENIDPNTIIGDGDPNDDGKADDRRNKILEDQKRFDEQLKKLAEERHIATLSDYQREIRQAEIKYEELESLAHGDAERLQKLETDKVQALHQITMKYFERDIELIKRGMGDREKAMQDFAAKAIKDGENFLNKFGANLEAGQQKQLQDKIAHLQSVVSTSGGLKQLKAQRELLKTQNNERLKAIEEERRQALAAAQGNADDRKRINDDANQKVQDANNEFRQAEFEAQLDFYTNLFSQITSFADSLLAITSNDQQTTARENAELARLQKRNDKEKAGHQKLLNNKLISQQEFNRRTKALDDNYRNQEAGAKKKQWERQQKADVQQAIISGAQAILSALQTKPFLLGLVLAGVAAIRTKKQIDVIKSQPAPEFGKGGHLTGPSHKQGGMPVINPRTGKKEAEVEGGEVILSKKTVRNNSAIVGALLQSSMYRNGATIKPLASTRTYKTIDFSGVTKSIQKVRHFENGGVFESGPTSTAGDAQQPIIVPTMTEQQEVLMQAILQQLQTPPKAYVVYSEIEAAGDKLTQIKDDARFAKQ